MSIRNTLKDTDLDFCFIVITIIFSHSNNDCKYKRINHSCYKCNLSQCYFVENLKSKRPDMKLVKFSWSILISVEKRLVLSEKWKLLFLCWRRMGHLGKDTSQYLRARLTKHPSVWCGLESSSYVKSQYISFRYRFSSVATMAWC